MSTAQKNILTLLLVGAILCAGLLSGFVFAQWQTVCRGSVIECMRINHGVPFAGFTPVAIAMVTTLGVISGWCKGRRGK